MTKKKLALALAKISLVLKKYYLLISAFVIRNQFIKDLMLSSKKKFKLLQRGTSPTLCHLVYF